MVYMHICRIMRVIYKCDRIDESHCMKKYYNVNSANEFLNILSLYEMYFSYFGITFTIKELYKTALFL